MSTKTDAERIKGLQDLCDQLDELRKKAEEICKEATSEMNRVKRDSQIERRSFPKKVKRNRRR